ncbi:hypothetical protein [Wolbachia endosymbiont (group E) of Neria commutata]
MHLVINEKGEIQGVTPQVLKVSEMVLYKVINGILLILAQSSV